MNILFVCTMNRWRSRTAETIFKNSGHVVQSAGTSEKARIRVTENVVNRADIIFVMEKKHKQILLEKYDVTANIIVLDIPDEYEYMDAELVTMLETAVAPYLQ